MERITGEIECDSTQTLVSDQESVATREGPAGKEMGVICAISMFDLRLCVQPVRKENRHVASLLFLSFRA